MEQWLIEQMYNAYFCIIGTEQFFGIIAIIIIICIFSAFIRNYLMIK